MSENVLSYNTIDTSCSGEITEKKSRFIANLYHVETEEEAAAIIEKSKKQYWDARHNCYAYILGRRSELMRFSDDGEPQGTAGKPILEVLKGAELTDTLAVVTRYFGGVLLGTGGLVRAYSEATKAGIDSGSEKDCVVCMTLMQPYSFTLDYQSIGRIKYTLSELGVDIASEEYTDVVALSINVPVNMCDRVEKALIEASNGQIQLDRSSIEAVYLKNAGKNLQ